MLLKILILLIFAYVSTQEEAESNAIKDATDAANKIKETAKRNGASNKAAAKICAAGEHLYKDNCVKNSNLVHLGKWATNKVKTILNINTPTVEDANGLILIMENHGV